MKLLSKRTFMDIFWGTEKEPTTSMYVLEQKNTPKNKKNLFMNSVPVRRNKFWGSKSFISYI